MCGIIGGNWFTSKEQTFTQLNKIIHRGRDASQVDVVDDFYIGHNRLSIQDLSSSANQPMWNDDKSVCIVYNGELWESDYTKKLEEKISLPRKTKSDTEIILNAYLQFGVESFIELDGMFSFCIVDSRINTAFVVRDYVGELPLWYAIDNDGKLVFASEKKGLPTADLYEKQVKTVYPGTYIEYNYKTLENSIKTYYTLPTEIINDDRETIVTNIRKMLEEAVKVKMVSDVPICTILSGGIDSVITTYILSKINPNIEAFVVSMGDGDTKNDDIKYARIAAKEFGVKLHEIILTEDDVINAIDETNEDVIKNMIGTEYPFSCVKQNVTYEMYYTMLSDRWNKIIDEVSVTAGYEFNSNTVSAQSGKNKFKFDIKEQGFAWIADAKIEFRMIKRMKKGSRIMITGYNQQGSQTIDHYSLLGFTKAYNATKKACS